MRTTIVRKRYGGRWATAAVPAGGGGRAWNGVYTKSKALFTGLTFKREIVHRNICNKILCRSERIKREKKKNTIDHRTRHRTRPNALFTRDHRRATSAFPFAFPRKHDFRARARPRLYFIPQAYSRTRVTRYNRGNDPLQRVGQT